MGMEEVVVTIAPDGTIKVATSGFTGMACTSATAGLEALLGNEIIDRTMTEEAFQTGESGTNLNLGQSW